MSAIGLMESKENKMDKDCINKNHFQYIDILRVFSMISVVFLHTLAGSLRANIGSLTWHVSNFLMTIMCTAVPIFFMISGAMTLNSKKTASISLTYKNRIPKIFIPFLVWSIVALMYFITMQSFLLKNINWPDIIYRLKNITHTSTTVHLWFMYVLIPMYILSPLLKRAIDALDKNHTRYLLLIWFLFSSLFPTIVALVPEGYKTFFTFNSVYGLNFMDGYLGFFILGYFLFKLDKSLSKKLLLFVISVDTLVIYFGSWWKTVRLGTFDATFNTYSRVFTLVLSVAIFLLIKEIMRGKSLSKGLAEIVSILSSLSFGIYLIHNLLVDLISNKINLYPAYSVQILFFSAFAVLCTSMFCIIILSSIKPICFIFTGLDYKTACNTCNLQYFLTKIKEYYRVCLVKFDFINYT